MHRFSIMGRGEGKCSGLVRLVPGDGKVIINDRPWKNISAKRPGNDCETASGACTMEGRFDVLAKVHGGGTTGQAGAIRLGLPGSCWKPTRISAFP